MNNTDFANQNTFLKQLDKKRKCLLIEKKLPKVLIALKSMNSIFIMIVSFLFFKCEASALNDGFKLQNTSIILFVVNALLIIVDHFLKNDIVEVIKEKLYYKQIVELSSNKKLDLKICKFNIFKALKSTRLYLTLQQIILISGVMAFAFIENNFFKFIIILLLIFQAAVTFMLLKNIINLSQRIIGFHLQIEFINNRINVIVTKQEKNMEVFHSDNNELIDFLMINK